MSEVIARLFAFIRIHPRINCNCGAFCLFHTSFWLCVLGAHIPHRAAYFHRYLRIVCQRKINLRNRINHFNTIMSCVVLFAHQLHHFSARKLPAFITTYGFRAKQSCKLLTSINCLLDDWIVTGLREGPRQSSIGSDHVTVTSANIATKPLATIKEKQRKGDRTGTRRYHCSRATT